MAKPAARNEAAYDMGTMWRMTRHEHVARCALISHPDEWELRVLVDGAPLMTKRCAEAHKALSIAEDWKRRMVAKGWRQVRPRFPLQVA